MTWQRPQAACLAARLRGPRQLIQVVSGPRQVGKTLLARQAVGECHLPVQFADVDAAPWRGADWIVQQWEIARQLAGSTGAILVLDEVQQQPEWSATVRRLWDEDSRRRCPLQVLLLGSAPLSCRQDWQSTLANRFMLLHLPHWSAAEMQAAFGWSVEQSMFFGGSPGAAAHVGDPAGWARYLREALIEATIVQDVLSTRVDKPALLRHFLAKGCAASGSVLSLTRLLVQLPDAGNTVTLSHYLALLGNAGLLTGLPKYGGTVARRRASIPKWQVLNTALLSLHADYTFAQAQADPVFWGQLEESAVGAHLINAAAADVCEVFYWRERHREVDFVVRAGQQLLAIEVNSGRPRAGVSGMKAFALACRPQRRLVVGRGGVPVQDFLLHPLSHWLADA